MVRKLALAVSLALGTWNVPVHALGLGELSSKSALNQNFQGDITLLSAKADELDTIRVKLADSEAFTRAGVDRPFYLSLLKFEPVLGDKGRPVIRVTSEFPIREPFMNFLVEVNWPNGRLLREYTVLLDPPTTTKRRPPAVAPAAKVAASTPRKAAVKPTTVQATPPAAPSGTVSTDGSEYGPVRANETAWSIAKKLRTGGVSMEQMMIALLNANPQAFVDGNINRLRRGQILRVPAISEIQELSRQAARAAYREQQDAWLARRDARLQQAAEAATEPTGTGETATGAAAAEGSDQLRIATARPEGQGEAGAGDDDARSTTAANLRDRLIVARENAETSRQEAESLRGQVDDLQDRLADMQRLLSLKDEQLAQLQDKVITGDEAAAAPEPVEPVVEPEAPATLEVTAESTPAWVPGPDYQIPEVVNQVDADRVVGGAGEDGTVSTEIVVESVPAGVADAVPETVGEVVQGETFAIGEIPPQIDADRIVQMADADGLVPESALMVEDGGAPVADVAVAPTLGSEEIVIEMAGESAVMPEPTAEPTAPVVAEIAPPVVNEPPVAAEPPTAAPVAAEPPAVQSESMLGMLERNMVPIAAGAVGLLGLFGWLATRRRREEAAPELAEAAAVANASAAATAADDEMDAIDQPMFDGDTMNDLADSSFLDEFSPSEINALQDETGEVDPVSEADVYIAYGRYQQAEELLRQALGRDPNRLALKHKLLEVHYATRNGDAFAALAQEMVDAGQDAADDDAWLRARDMGRELMPDHPLFAARDGEVGLSGAVSGVAAAAAAVDEDTLSLNDLELSELNSAYADSDSAEETLDPSSEVSILLDLEQASELADDAVEDLPASIPLEDLDSLDFEMPESESASEAVAKQTGSDSLDLDSMMADAEAAVDQDENLVSLDSDFSADDLQAQLDELSDLSMLDSSLDDSSDLSSREAPAGLGLVAEDTGAADSGVDEPLSLDAAFDTVEIPDDDASETIELDDSMLAGSGEAEGDDEVTTKLDLARAYLDMGDQDGARDILAEVVVEGNDMQRGDAEQMLARLG